MAMICKKCGGIIPDIVFGGTNRNDCKHHIKQHYDIKVETGWEMR